MPVLEVHDAHKRFGPTHALAGVNLTLQSGEWLGLLGPNGAGKTTLVRAIAGRVRLDRGTVRLFDHTLDGGREARLARQRIGVVPQELAIYPKLTAAENLHTFGRYYGLTGRVLRERVDWALAFSGLAARAGELVDGFSGGMKRRLNVAAGVLHRPEVILLDEPTVGVDPQSRQRIWEMLDTLRRDGAALVLTTHQLDEAQTVCDRIVIIDHGRTIADGSLAELIQQTIGPQRRVVLTFDRQPPRELAAERAEIAGRQLVARVSDVGPALQVLLDTASHAGLRVEDVHVEAPSLHAVFLHLTGRELRE